MKTANNALRGVVLLPLAAKLILVLLAITTATARERCPTYALSGLAEFTEGIEASLTLSGPPCTSSDIASLKLYVKYETDARLRVRIVDAASKRYEVPELLFPRPKVVYRSGADPASQSLLSFSYEASPFSFTITRRSDKEVLFSTKSSPLIYRQKHIQIKSVLPPNPNIYGLGESTDSFRINVEGDGTRRTLWARDAYGKPQGTNLYGSHPIYYDHRQTGTHGVFLLNSNGMDITIKAESLQYDIIGGILDFYFLAGPSPVQVAQQYASLAGLPAMVPYWSLGFQQCRYGYTDYVQVAEVIANYSNAGIPLETMWTDIDYMFERRTFTLDPEYFPLNRMREIVDGLHSRGQRYVMMVDPAVAYQPGDKGAFDRGLEADIFLKEKDGSLYKGVVWAGVSAYPDWFHPNAQSYWTKEVENFFHPKSGIDIDGIWIDMNEPANFASPCAFPCKNATLLPEAQASASQNPPRRKTEAPPKDHRLPSSVFANRKIRRDDENARLDPAIYVIHNAAGDLDKGTARTDLVHHNGLLEYDTHNLYGSHMSLITRNAMLSRRPKVRPQVITRSIFAGAGRYAAHWTGDNLSEWPQYVSSIAEIISHAALYQVPFVGADVCGFGKNTQPDLCSRWASLGAFYPFFRNHNEMNMISQEFYRWPEVASSARNAIKIRYSLLDYFYTYLRRQSITGEPAIKPLWFSYPRDHQTFSIDTQFFFGDSILISPVLGPSSTSVHAYFPEKHFFDFETRVPTNDQAGPWILKDIAIDRIPVHIKPGSVIPLRQVVLHQKDALAQTTTEVRKRSFEILVALDNEASAKGSLYLDDGESLETPPEHTAELEFGYTKHTLSVSGRIGAQLPPLNTNVHQWTFIGVPNIKNLKDVRVIGSPNLLSKQDQHPGYINLNTNIVELQGAWKLLPGTKVELVYL